MLLCSSAGLGILVRPRLPEHHRTRETMELMQITIGLLVTFAALVLGLLTASVKQALIAPRMIGSDTRYNSSCWTSVYETMDRTQARPAPI